MALIFNREELYSRKTLPLGKYLEDNYIYAGRDVSEGGTWFGLNEKTQNIAFLTNRNQLSPVIKHWLGLKADKMPVSRGTIINNYLSSNFYEKYQNQQQLQKNDETSEKIQQNYIKEVQNQGNQFGLCNLIFGNFKTMKFFSFSNKNLNSIPEQIQSGFHTLCSYNKFGGKQLDKEKKGQLQFQKIVNDFNENNYEQVNNNNKQFFEKCEEMAFDKTQYKSSIFNNMFKNESTIFINKYYNYLRGHKRGTKSITMLLVQFNGNCEIKEIHFDTEGKRIDNKFQFNLVN